MKKLDSQEVLSKIFECEFKDIQPIKDSIDNVYICMTEETYKYLIKFKELQEKEYVISED